MSTSYMSAAVVHWHERRAARVGHEHGRTWSGHRGGVTSRPATEVVRERAPRRRYATNVFFSSRIARAVIRRLERL